MSRWIHATTKANAFKAAVADPWSFKKTTGPYYDYHPALADMDADGDLDLLIGSYGYPGYSPALYYYQNTGTATKPTLAAPVSNEAVGTTPMLRTGGATGSSTASGAGVASGLVSVTATMPFNLWTTGRLRHRVFPRTSRGITPCQYRRRSWSLVTSDNC